MRRFLVVTLAALALAGPMAACTTMQQNAIATANLDTERGSIIAEFAYQGFANGILAAIQSDPAHRETYQALNRRVYAYLLGLRAGTETVQTVLDAIAGAGPALRAAAAAPH